MVKNLNTRLVECDPIGSVRCFTNINPYLFKETVESDRNILQQQISNYQYDEARKTLRIIANKLKKLYS